MKYLISIFAMLTIVCSCTNNNAQKQSSNPKEGGGLLVEAYNNGDWEKILSICDTLYDEKDSKNIAIIYSEALAATGNFEASIEVLDRKMAQEPGNYYVLQSKGNTYSVAEQYDSAIYYFDRVIEMKPTYARPYINKGDIYTRLDDKENAISNYMKAVYLFDRNSCLDEVYQYCNKILELDPSNKEALEYLRLVQESNQ